MINNLLYLFTKVCMYHIKIVIIYTCITIKNYITHTITINNIINNDNSDFKKKKNRVN